MNRNIIALGCASLLAAFTIGYWAAPREILDNEVEHVGVFTTDTKSVLSATVTSLKAENKLIIYRYDGETRVSIERSKFFVLHGSQELFVPASVTYLLDMADLGQEDVTYNEKTKTVLVKLPKLKMGDIAFQPERARKINGGMLTFSSGVVDELEKINYRTARKAFVKQAQQPTLVEAARAQAVENITAYFEIPLRAVGDPNIKARVYFP